MRHLLQHCGLIVQEEELLQPLPPTRLDKPHQQLCQAPMLQKLQALVSHRRRGSKGTQVSAAACLCVRAIVQAGLAET